MNFCETENLRPDFLSSASKLFPFLISYQLSETGPLTRDDRDFDDLVARLSLAREMAQEKVQARVGGFLLLERQLGGIILSIMSIARDRKLRVLEAMLNGA